MAKKRIEEVINTVLKGDAQQNALDFVAYLRDSEIPIEESESYWEIRYMDECVCFIWINGSDDLPGPWTIWSAQIPGTWAAWGDYEYIDFPLDERIKETAWKNVNVCGNCGDCSNVGGIRKTVLGKEFDNLCNSTMAFTNPDAEALKCAKKMVEIRKNDILKNMQCSY